MTVPSLISLTFYLKARSFYHLNPYILPTSALRLQELYDVLEMGQSIIFCRTKREADMINEKLQVCTST